MAPYWKYLIIGVAVILIISLTAYISAWRAGSKLTRDCILIKGLTMEDLNAPVEMLYLTTAKLFPLVNTIYASHWLVVVKTGDKYLALSSGRYMCMNIYPVIRKDPYHFVKDPWEKTLYILKQYELADPTKPVSAYEIAKEAMGFYNKDNEKHYNIVNHNCQHVSQFIIRTFASVEPNDTYMIDLKGIPLIKTTFKDALKGPKNIL